MSEWHKDEHKVRVDLLPPEALLAAARAFSYGCEKYGDRNWEKHADDWSWGQLVGSILRHLLGWMQREDLDDESSLNHLDHLLADAMMLATLVETDRGKDDRSKLQVIDSYETIYPEEEDQDLAEGVTQEGQTPVPTGGGILEGYVQVSPQKMLDIAKNWKNQGASHPEGQGGWDNPL